MEKIKNEDEKCCVICKKTAPLYDLKQFERNIFLKFAAILKVRQNFHLKYSNCEVENPEQSSYHVQCLHTFRRLPKNYIKMPKNFENDVQEQWPVNEKLEIHESAIETDNHNENSCVDSMVTDESVDNTILNNCKEKDAALDDSYRTITRYLSLIIFEYLSKLLAHYAIFYTYKYVMAYSF